MAAPIIAYPLGLFDCCGVSDGSACAIVTTVERAREMGKTEPCDREGPPARPQQRRRDGAIRRLGRGPLHDHRPLQRPGLPGGGHHPSPGGDQHDGAPRLLLHHRAGHLRGPPHLRTGQGVEGRAGRVFTTGTARLPCQVDGGLKCFGHPIGASGLRMLYEMYLQLQGRAGERQLPNPRYGLTHNLGGVPFMNMCSIAIVGRYQD